MTCALIVEDELQHADELREELARQWPELSTRVVQDGHAALREIEVRRPDVLFLDMHAPGLSVTDIARVAGSRCLVVFISDVDRHAVTAFDEGAVDYLLKPLAPARLARALGRVRERLVMPPDAGFRHDRRKAPIPRRMQWVTVLSGREMQFIGIDDILYFRADSKYVAVVTADGESLIKTPLRDLMERLDPAVFWQINRGVVVNAHAIRSARRTPDGHMEVTLRKRADVLRASAAYTHLFKHM